MAHFKIDTTKPAGSRLVSAAHRLEQALGDFVREFRTIEASRSGDGSQDAHYTAIAADYGFESAALAHLAYPIIEAMAGRLDTDGGIDTLKSTLANGFRDVRN